MEIRRNWSASKVPTVVTVGNFDGVHLGHQRLLSAVRSRKGDDLAALVITFEPHPLVFLDLGRAPPRLVDLRSKSLLLASEGIDRINVMAFNSRLASLSPEEFVERLLSSLKMRTMVVGSDFRFGHKRAGDVGTLKSLASSKDFSLKVVDDSVDGQDRISSKLVRGLISTGNFARAARLLGRSYRISGRVVRGRRLGRELGWPTANIRFAGRPAIHGIYAAHAYLHGERWPAAVSVGTRPAVNGSALTVEAHLIGYSGDAYGARLEIEPTVKIRDECDFAGLDELRSAIALDVKRCAELLSA